MHIQEFHGCTKALADCNSHIDRYSVRKDEETLSTSKSMAEGAASEIRERG